MSKRRQSELVESGDSAGPAPVDKKAKRGSAAGTAAASADVHASPTAVPPIDADAMDDVPLAVSTTRLGRSPAPGRGGTPGVDTPTAAGAAGAAASSAVAPVDPNAVASSPVHLSKSDMGPHLKLSTDGLTVVGQKGYRMIRATHGLAEGALYFEVKWLPSPELIVSGKKTTPAVRLGVATTDADIQAPVGYDIHSYAFCSVGGNKAHNAHVSEYASAGFAIGDVVGVWLVLPPDVATAAANAADAAAADTRKAGTGGGKKGGGSKASKKNFAQIAQALAAEAEMLQAVEEPADEPEIKMLTDAEVVQSKKFHKRSFLRFYKNGHSVVGADAPLASAFTDILRAKYFPAISLYMGAQVKINFGPDFWCPPEEVMAGVAAAQAAQATALAAQQQQNGGDTTMADVLTPSSPTPPAAASPMPVTFPADPAPAVTFRHPLARPLLTSGLFAHVDGSGTALVPNPIQQKANADAAEEARQKQLIQAYEQAKRQGLVASAQQAMAEANAAAAAATAPANAPTNARASSKNAN